MWICIDAFLLMWSWWIGLSEIHTTFFYMQNILKTSAFSCNFLLPCHMTSKHTEGKFLRIRRKWSAVLVMLIFQQESKSFLGGFFCCIVQSASWFVFSSTLGSSRCVSSTVNASYTHTHTLPLCMCEKTNIQGICDNRMFTKAFASIRSFVTFFNWRFASKHPGWIVIPESSSEWIPDVQQFKNVSHIFHFPFSKERHSLVCLSIGFGFFFPVLCPPSNHLSLHPAIY